MSAETILTRLQALEVAPPDPDSNQWKRHYNDHLHLIRENAEDAMGQCSGAFSLLFCILLIGISIMKSSTIISFFAILPLIVFTMSFTGLLRLIRRRMALFKRKDEAALERLKSVDRAAFQEWKAKLNVIALEWWPQRDKETEVLVCLYEVHEHLTVDSKSEASTALNSLLITYDTWLLRMKRRMKAIYAEEAALPKRLIDQSLEH